MKCLHRRRPVALRGFVEVWFQITLGALQTAATGTLAWYHWRAGVELPQAEAELKAAGYSLDVVENASTDVPDEGNFGATEPIKDIATREADQTPEIKERLAVLRALNMYKRPVERDLNGVPVPDLPQNGRVELKNVPGGPVNRPQQKELRMPDLSGEIDWPACREWIANGLKWEVPRDEVDPAQAVLTALRLRMEPIYPALLAAAQNRKHAAWTPGQRTRFKETVQRGDVVLEFFTVGGSFMPLLRIIQLRQEAALACGMEEVAADLTKVLFSCSDLCVNETSLINFLVRITMDQMIFDAARRSLSEGRLNAALLAEYQMFFAARPYVDQFERAMQMELAAGHYMMTQIVDQKISLDEIKSVFGLSDMDRYKVLASPLTQGITKVFFDLGRARHIRHHLAGLQALKSGGFPGLFRWAKEFENSRRTGPLDALLPGFLLSIMTASSYSGLMPGVAYKEMSRRAFIVECALERHRLAGGATPDKLSSVPKELLAEVPLDLDGQPIRYRRVKNAFVLWSVGLDLEDEVKADEPLYPPKEPVRTSDQYLNSDWRWWHLDP